MLKDPLLRRFVSGSLFAMAFIWVAVRHFNVDTEVMRVLALLSFLFVGLLILAGLILAPVIRLLRRKSHFLSSLPDGTTDRDAAAGDEPPAPERPGAGPPDQS